MITESLNGEWSYRVGGGKYTKRTVPFSALADSGQTCYNIATSIGIGGRLHEHGQYIVCPESLRLQKARKIQDRKW